jgi:hypothetical protein
MRMGGGWNWFRIVCSGVQLQECCLVSKMDLRETGYEDGWWMELPQDRVQWGPATRVLFS